MKLKVMTYNIQSGRNAFYKLDMNAIIQVIKKEKPDIIGINEVRRCTKDIGTMDQAQLLGKELHMHMYFAEAMAYQGGSYGNVLLSKVPIEEAQALIIPKGGRAKNFQNEEPRVVLQATLLFGEMPINVVVTHLGVNEEEQREGVVFLEQLLKATTKPTLLMGDYNMEPDNSILHPLKKSTTAAGWTDKPYTFSSLKPERKIDYVLSNDQISIEGQWVVQTTASDHLPLIAQIRL